LGDQGLQVIDISDPTAPVILGSVTSPGYATDVASSGDLAYVVDGAGLQVIDIFNLNVLDDLATNPLLLTTQTNLQGYQNLVDAYITLGMPELMEESPVVRAALRSDATVGELAVGPVDEIVSGYISSPDISIFPWGQVAANLQLLQDEVNATLANPSVGHGYVDYMLAELEHLKDNAFKLAIDDAYFTSFGETLIVGAGAGLLANDVDQQFRNIQVDLLFDQEPEYVAPQNGSLTLFADGSFNYTPDPGFGGTDSFTYRTFTDVGSLILDVYSDPATVVVDVGITVENINDAGAGSLRDAIANAPAGSLIRFDPALDQPILLSSQLNLTRDVNLDASTLPSGLTLDGGGTTRVLHIDSGVVANLTGLTITRGQGGNGGGIENVGGTVNLLDVNLIANESPSYGGAIINLGGIVTATNTTFADNIAGFGGGGISNTGGSAIFTLINSTLTGNAAQAAGGGGGGGGVRSSTGALNLIHTTVVGNESSLSSGGGIQNNGGTLSVENSIIAGNTAGTVAADIASNTTVLTAGQNLIGDHEGVEFEFPVGPFAGTALNPVLPILGPLADNGGPTLTMLPLPGSPAIDAAITGVNTPLADQRGTLRPEGAGDDIGSVEAVPEPGAVMGMLSGALFLAFLARRREQAGRLTFPVIPRAIMQPPPTAR
jgi:hypothetical protein